MPSNQKKKIWKFKWKIKMKSFLFFFYWKSHQMLNVVAHTLLFFLFLKIWNRITQRKKNQEKITHDRTTIKITSDGTRNETKTKKMIIKEIKSHGFYTSLAYVCQTEHKPNQIYVNFWLGADGLTISTGFFLFNFIG